MTSHGYVDEDGRPRLVLTIPAGDSPAAVEAADKAARAGWLAWIAECDDPALLVRLTAAAIAAGVPASAIGEARG